jgi:hypothetical protein
LPTFDTANNIMGDAALELGLTSDATTFTASDPTYAQMWALLKSSGQDVARIHDWTHLQQEKVLTTDGTGSYVLPADFRSMIQQTGWNRTTRFPFGGPLSPQEWQYVSALTSVAPLTVLFRPARNKLLIYNDVAGRTVAYEYRSTYWVKSSGASVPDRDYPQDTADTLWLDRLLLVRALKLAWLRAKGLPSDSAYQDYVQALDVARGDDSPAPVLAMSGDTYARPRLIDALNIPETGFGS